MRGRLYIGTSGYQYPHWRGVFYPDDLPKSRWFEFYARHFDTVEINNTFYRLPGATVFDDWRDAAPAGFIYALKFSGYATHRKKLKDTKRPVQMFTQRAQRLKSRLGPILVQLPPHWHANLDRLDRFLPILPREYRWIVEFRDPTWLCDPVFDALARYGVGLCWHDLLPRHPHRLTAGFSYFRFHGRHYAGNYSAAQLKSHARKIRDYLARGVGVYAYFNNDAEGYAVGNALDLRDHVERGGASTR